MAAKRVKIFYSDESVVEVKITPRAQVNTERHIGGDWDTMAILSVFRMAWEAARQDNKETPDFETWLDLVDDVEQIEEKASDPTESAQSSDSSSN